MGVPKIAVMAIVTIMSIPILMGYALNLNEIIIDDYKVNDDPLNVTQLLQTGTDWNVAAGDPYKLNTSARSLITSSIHEISAYPIYNRVTTTKTTLPVSQGYVPNWEGGDDPNMANYQDYQIYMDYNVNQGVSASVKVWYNNGNSTTSTMTNVFYFRYTASTNQVYMLMSNNYNGSSMSEYDATTPNITKLEVTITGGDGTVALLYDYVYKSGHNEFADLSEGYYFQKFSNKPSGLAYGWTLRMPENTTSVLMSINLDSITDSNYTMQLEQIGSYPMELIKTTTDGVVSWQLHRSGTGYFDLYYNPNISDNTYQVLLTATGEHTGHAQFRYVGHWQKTIGEAKYYQTYDTDYSQSISQGNPLDTITIVANDNYNSRTATIRIDAATFQAYEYPVIQGTLDPKAFKSNPSTSISNVEQYGTQIIFGGNTYNVTNGKITINSHQIPVDNLVLDSVPDADTLQYDNRINGTVISTTASPSTIQFVGNWSADVVVSSMDSTTYTKTEWTPGEFSWDGIDHNFLMVGMLTAIGVFVGLGIYARSHNMRIWPVLLVCSGAILLFFCMI